MIGGVYVAVGTASSLFLSDMDRIGGLVAALCAGAFFHPMRRVLQRGADRLLYGGKGDPVALAAGLGRRLQRTDPEGGLAAALEVLRDGLAVTGTGVRFQGGWPEESTVGTLEEVRATSGWSGTASPSAACSSARRGPGGCRPRTTSGTSPRSRRTWPTPPTRPAGRRAAALPGAIVTTREEERRRLRRDLHDGLGQSLSGMAMSINAARLSLRSSPEAAERMLGELRSGMDSVTNDIRHLVYGLRPPALDDLGLAGAVAEMAGPGVSVEVGASCRACPRRPRSPRTGSRRRR